jgi:hypothetical protein
MDEPAAQEVIVATTIEGWRPGAEFGSFMRRNYAITLHNLSGPSRKFRGRSSNLDKSGSWLVQQQRIA